MGKKSKNKEIKLLGKAVSIFFFFFFFEKSKRGMEK